jgi:predicted Zn-dependent protease
VDLLEERADQILDELLNGHVDHAEHLCQQFIADFPGEAEGLDLLSMIYEERGQRQRALDLLRQASAIAHAKPDYDDETRSLMRERIKELELRA